MMMIAWMIYRGNGRRTRNQGFLVNRLSCKEKPPEATKLISTYSSSRLTLRIESKAEWECENDDIAMLTNINPYKGEYVDIEEGFEISKECERILIDDFIIPEDECKAIAESIRNRTARAISDGSFIPDQQKGSSAFIITPGRTIQNRFEGYNWVPGQPDDQNPYRSELAGMNGVLSAIAVIVKYYGIKEGEIEIALDGLSAMKQASTEDYHLSIHQSCFDIIQDIRNRIEMLPIKIKWRWVEGHQKERGRTKLDWWGRQNERVDLLCKKYLTRCIRTKRQYKSVRLWYEKWALYLNGIKQTTICKKKLYSELRKENIISYWKSHHDFPIRNSETISWEPQRMAVKQLGIGHQRFYVKFLSGHIGNRHMLKHHREINNSQCLNCKSCRIEKSSHVLKCTNEKAQHNHKLKIKVDLKKELEAKNTCPILAKIIEDLLLKWKKGTPIDPENYTTDFNIRDAVNEQSKIGWTNWAIGRWSPKWQQVQKRYYKSIKSKRSSLRWTAAIIKKIILICWDVWDFRNTLIHGKGGVVDCATNKELDFQIRQQFFRGKRNLLPRDKKLFRKYNKKTLLNKTIEEKRSWVRSMENAREAFYRLGLPPTTTEQQTLDQFITTHDNNLD